MSSRLRAAVLLGVVLVLATLFRLPALLNAGAINSDAAVVGLQARHILHGEIGWHLWGTDYQGAFDSLLMAISFVFFGAKPIAAFLVPYVGLLVMVALAFDVLRRYVGTLAAAIAVMPLVFAPMASNSPMIYVMRQSLATTVTLGVWLADRAGPSKRNLLLAGAAFLFGLYIDFFAMVLVPPVAVLLLSMRLDEKAFERLAFGRFGRVAVVGGALVVVVALVSGVVPVARIGANARLLAGTCLPFALGTKVFIKGEALVAQPWDAPLALVFLQWIGALVFALSLLSSGPAVFVRKLPWEVRRLGLFAFVVLVCTVAAFLVSTKPVDMWSSRYLAPIFWTSPFALVPLARLVEPRKLALAHLPYWVTALIGGWLSYGLYVDGPVPRIDARARAVEEGALRAELLKEGIHEGEAQYWIAYRLSFLFEEDPIIVPIDRKGDRYRPYRDRVDAAKMRALIFHPSEPRATPEPYEAELRARGASYERREIAGFTVLFVR